VQKEQEEEEERKNREFVAGKNTGRGSEKQVSIFKEQKDSIPEVKQSILIKSEMENLI